MFRSSHFWFLVTFGNEVAKLRKYDVIFVYILKGKMSKTVKTRRANHATSDQNTKNQKTKIWDGRNKRHEYEKNSNPLLKAKVLYWALR